MMWKRRGCDPRRQSGRPGSVARHGSRHQAPLRQDQQDRGSIMTDSNRRSFLGGLVVAAGGIAATPSLAAGSDGHATGYDVAPASNFVLLIPRRSGDPVAF